MTRHFAFLFALLICVSCSSRFSFQKKRYSRGYYFCKNSAPSQSPTIPSRCRPETGVKEGREELVVNERINRVPISETSLPISSQAAVRSLKMPVAKRSGVSENFKRHLAAGFEKKHVTKQTSKGTEQVFGIFRVIAGIVLCLIGLSLVIFGVVFTYLSLLLPGGIALAVLSALIAWAGICLGYLGVLVIAGA